MTSADLPGLNALLEGHPRVWLVYSPYSQADPQQLVPQALAAHYQLVGQRDFYGVTVQFYAAP